jgi:hypothetical protein
MVASLAPPSLGPSLSNAEADYGVHTVLLALRSLAKDLSTVPGRKTLVMLTSGFPLTVEFSSEVTAVIDTCNKANVAIYPIDVRGLIPDPHRTFRPRCTMRVEILLVLSCGWLRLSSRLRFCRNMVAPAVEAVAVAATVAAEPAGVGQAAVEQVEPAEAAKVAAGLPAAEQPAEARPVVEESPAGTYTTAV